MPAPRWVRALLALDRGFNRVVQLEMALRDELLLALVPRARRDHVTASIYERDATYSPGGAIFDNGLFSWEEHVLAHPSLPRDGRVLVGGAGGGREVAALCARGFDVVAFEPVETLARACATAATNARVLRGRYADLGVALEGQGPLAPLVDGKPYALVLLGWRSLSHVIDPEARAQLFSDLARVAPGAPVIASFASTGPRTRARALLRRAFTRLGRDVPPQAMFLPWAGFAVALDRGDLEAAAAPSGYAVALFHAGHESYALLLPTAKSC